MHSFVSHRYITWAAFASVLILAGCSTTPTSTSPSTKSPQASSKSKLPPAGSGRGGYYKDDGPGDITPDGLENTPDAVPTVEPYSRSGNKPYAVFGQTYTPITQDKPFKQRGIASWYGKKFHKKRTSSGEPYDMYKMSAAHPTLPIPSYARVTNLRNGKSVIVRVNDRGPFHSKRIMDLSYTAALKLGYINQGSSEVEVERLLPADIIAMNQNAPSATSRAMLATIESAPLATSTPSDHAPNGIYLQFGAYTQQANAEAVHQRLALQFPDLATRLSVTPVDDVYRVFAGPFTDRQAADASAAQLQQQGISTPIVVTR